MEPSGPVDSIASGNVAGQDVGVANHCSECIEKARRDCGIHSSVPRGQCPHLHVRPPALAPYPIWEVATLLVSRSVAWTPRGVIILSEILPRYNQADCICELCRYTSMISSPP
jgi:hypothetical protein